MPTMFSILKSQKGSSVTFFTHTVEVFPKLSLSDDAPLQVQQALLALSFDVQTLANYFHYLRTEFSQL